MYLSGTPTSLADVLNTLGLFLETVTGWGVDRNDWRAAPGDTSVRELCFHNGDDCYNLTRKIAGYEGHWYEYLVVNGATSYSAGSDSDDQPGNTDPLYAVMAGESASNPPTLAPSAYFFFADANALFVVIAVAANVYQVLTFQSILKNSTWTGGSFVGAYYTGGGAPYPGGINGYYSWFKDANPAAYLRVGSTWKALAEYSAGFGMLAGGAPQQPNYAQLLTGFYRSEIDGRAALPFVWVNDGAGASWPAGQLRNCVWCPKANTAPRQTIMFAQNAYMVFPAVIPDDTGNGNNTRLAILVEE